MAISRKKMRIILIIVAVIIKLYSLSPEWVERYYSNGIYPIIAVIQRFLLGWIPFSIGDIFYAIIIFWMIKALIIFFKKLWKKEISRTLLKTWSLGAFDIALWIYVVFNLLWGLNYNRIPLADQLSLNMEPYSTGELDTLLQQLVTRVNVDYPSAAYNRAQLQKKRTLFTGAADAYTEVKKQYPFLQYTIPSVKPSLFSYFGNYAGYTGYYNPITGEAQVNTTVPLFVRPFTTCHEIGHQLGFAKENEANFAGFLSAAASTDAGFRYSVYFELYNYAIRDMFRRDSVKAKALHRQLKDGVREDFVALKQFYLKYTNPLEPIITSLYTKFLQANDQPQGMMSYSEVVAMVIGYRRKYHKN